MPPCLSEQELLSVDLIFTIFPSKLEIPIYMNVVFLKKLDNFHIGRF
jgi:hypothetical protein